MSSLVVTEVSRMWRAFLIDFTFAQNYTIGYTMLPGLTPRNPILERLLPSFLHIRATAVLDHALRAHLDDRRLAVPKSYGNGLKGRVDYLADHGHLVDRLPLHLVCGRRNKLAHEPAGEISWQDLKLDVLAIHSALSELSLVGEMPNWEIAAERSAAQTGEVPGAICTFHHTIEIRQGSESIAEIKWSNHLMADDA
jgi:hypothetical protein